MPDCTNKPCNLLPPQEFASVVMRRLLWGWGRLELMAQQGRDFHQWPCPTTSGDSQQSHDGDIVGPGPLAMATALRPNVEPQRVEQRQRCPLPAPVEAYVAFPHCCTAFSAISEPDPGRGYSHLGPACHLLGVSIGCQHNYVLGCWCTLNNGYPYWQWWELDWAEERTGPRCGQLTHRTWNVIFLFWEASFEIICQNIAITVYRSEDINCLVYWGRNGTFFKFNKFNFTASTAWQQQIWEGE